MAETPSTPPRFEDLPDMVTPEDAMSFLQMSRNTVYALLKSGEIPSIKFGRLIRIQKNALVGR